MNSKSNLKIISTPDPRLRMKSTKVRFDDPEVAKIIEKMKSAALEWEKEHPHEISAAIAAPQLGINRRIILIRDNDSKEDPEFIALLNPEVIRTSGKIREDFEGCLSVPEVYGKIKRPNNAKIKALLEDGREVRIKAVDMQARTLMHEIDHLNGILFIDYIRDNPDKFYKLDEEGEIKKINGENIINNKKYFPDEN